MYLDARDALREYVQNALDACRDASVNGDIGSDDGQIIIHILKERNSVTIKDNGSGIRTDEAADRLLSIGKSSKKLGESAGFRGIGRLAGIAYCDKLVFTTTACGESTGLKVLFDCTSLRQNFDSTKDSEVKTVEEALRESCTILQFDALEDEHYFHVEMIELVGDGLGFKDPINISDYISQNAPVDFDNQKFPYASTIRKKIKGLPFGVPVINVTITDDDGHEWPVFKPYKSHYAIKGGTPFDILGVDFFEDDSGDGAFWGWYGKCDLLGSITDSKSAGIRVRMDNISIGSAAIIDKLFGEQAASNARFNNYFIGEIHLRPGVATPNGRRDDFEDTDGWRNIKKELLKHIEPLSQDVRASSTDRGRSPKKIEIDAAKAIENAEDLLDSGMPSKEARDKQIDMVDRQLAKVEKALKNKDRKPEDVKLIEKSKNKLTGVRDRLSKVAKFKADTYPSLSRKQRQVLKIVYDVLQRELDVGAYNRVRAGIDKAFLDGNGE